MKIWMNKKYIAQRSENCWFWTLGLASIDELKSFFEDMQISLL